MVATFAFLTTDEDPSITLRWNDKGSALNLSTATFTVRLMDSSGATVLTSAGTSTGYSSHQGTSPYDYNFIHSFAGGELAITAGTYRLVVQATISSRQRTFSPGNLPTVLIVSAPS